MRYYRADISGNIPIDEKEFRRLAHVFTQQGKSRRSPIIFIDAPECRAKFRIQSNANGLYKGHIGTNNDEPNYEDKVTSLYIKKELIQQVILLFQDNVKIRDSRLGTINYIISTYYRGWFGRDIIVSSKILFDIDRAFRFVQQHFPELRGSTWASRQKRGGELVEDDDTDIKDMQELGKQLRIKFE